MATQDIRSGDDVERGLTIREDKTWMNKLPIDRADPFATSFGARIPTKFGGKQLLDENGQPMGLTGQIGQYHDEVAIGWQKKMRLEPCMLCAHFLRGRFTAEQKALFVMNLVRDHGWTPDLIEADLGDIQTFEFCRVYRLLTHPHASCPKNFRRRDGW